MEKNIVMILVEHSLQLKFISTVFYSVMKIYKYLFIFLILSLTSFGFSQKDTNQRDENNFKTGHWIYYGKDRPELDFCSECKVEEGDFINDRKEGVWIKYHSNGNPKLKGEFENGRPHGSYEKFWENGIIKERGCFRNTKCLNDSVYFYNEEGVLIRTDLIKYKYSPNGKIKESSDCSRKNDTITNDRSVNPDQNKQNQEIIYQPSMNTKSVPFNPDGYNKVYNEKNELYLEGIFNNGLLWDGKHYVFDLDGILLKVEVYKEGKYFGEGQL